VEDDWRSELENSPMSRYFAVREEDLFKICAVRFKCLASLLHQGVKGGLEDVALIKVLDVFEVVDFPVELPKCVRTGNKQEPEAPARSRANRIFQFGKLTPALAAVRGTIDSDEGTLLPAN
jgi:hypothetical protein